ncbi:MAG: NAD(P)/FAD-dependent oxidoreductase [Pyrinomonadaceae bacterium]
MPMGKTDYDVIIAGGGPAGSSAAIHLALRGARVLLAEQKTFPRPKLCGEFISPECTAHFERLGVAGQMFAAGPSNLTETVFYSQSGANIRVPSDWFKSGVVALGLSRAEMDERLLRRAAAVGVEVLEDAPVVNLIFDQERIAGVTVKRNGAQESFHAPITIDATGRARTLTRMAQRVSSVQAQSRRTPLVAFKAHLCETRGAHDACEIYSYRGGYGGLNRIENGLSNLCFIVNAGDVRARQSDANRVMREIVCQNQRAAYTLSRAEVQTEWLAVSLEGFGRHSAAPAHGLLAIGDAASFIDPFTGSGMLMALESGDLAAAVIEPRLPGLHNPAETHEIGKAHAQLYKERFSSRLRLCSLLRHAAFVPGLADLAISVFGASETLRRRVTQATRSRSQRNLSSAHSCK